MRAKKAKPRKKIPKAVEAELLLSCRRRCCLCYYLNENVKTTLNGQIAHIDHDPSNNDLNNLAYLCLEHHEQYDSRTSQTKKITASELHKAKNKLSDYIDRCLSSDKDSCERVVITIDGDFESFNNEECEKLLQIIKEASGIRGGVKVIQQKRGSIQLELSLTSTDAQKLYCAFNENKLTHTGVMNIQLLPPYANSIEFHGKFDTSILGGRVVTKLQAVKTITHADSCQFISAGNDVPREKAACGLFVKEFGKRDKYAIIVVMHLMEPSNPIVMGAIRAHKSDLGSWPISRPLDLVREFAETFGAQRQHPALGTSSLFVDAQTPIPPIYRDLPGVQAIMELIPGTEPAYVLIIGKIESGESELHFLLAVSMKKYNASLRGHKVLIR